MRTDNIYFSSDKFKELTDEELIEQIQEENEDALSYLCEKYRELVNIKVSKYFIIGAEREDIFQEGMIGLFKAIKSYKNDKQNSFKSFANMCIERQLITAIKTSNRQKHMPLNSYLSLNSSISENGENGETELFEIFKTENTEDPLEKIMKEEEYSNIQETINKTLSKFEKQVLRKIYEWAKLHRYSK